jgi:hypothetical protein
MYGLAPAPQQTFINPDTQQVASNGFVWFYRDADRATIKPVYQNTGTAGNPVYTQYPLNPDGSISLNASGAFPHFVYYFPYTEEGVIDLYYVVAKTSDGLDILAEGNYPTVNVDNGQIVFIISTACDGAPDLADQTQLSEAVSQYVHNANFYIDSSNVANVYTAVRNVADGERYEMPCQLRDGLIVRFSPNVTNTGDSNFTFTTKAGTTTLPIRQAITGTALDAGMLQGFNTWGVPACGYELTYRQTGGNVWILTNDPHITSNDKGLVYATDADPNPPETLINKLEAGAGISIEPSADDSHVVINQAEYIATGGAASTTQGIAPTTAVLGQLYLTLTLPAPPTNTCSIKVDLSIPGVICRTSPGAIALDVNGTRVNSVELDWGASGPNSPPSGIYIPSVSLSYMTTADSGTNLVEVYFGTVIAGLVSLCEPLGAPAFPHVSILAAKYIIEQ